MWRGRGVLAEPFVGGIVGGAMSEGGGKMVGGVERDRREEGGVLRGERCGYKRRIFILRT